MHVNASCGPLWSYLYLYAKHVWKKYILDMIDEFSRYTWVEFIREKKISTTSFTQNRSIDVKRHQKTPYELINHRKPNVKFFHIFSCYCFILNNTDYLGKIDKKTGEGKFLNYYLNSKAYRVFNNKTKRLLKSISVFFDDRVQMTS